MRGRLRKRERGSETGRPEVRWGEREREKYRETGRKKD